MVDVEQREMVPVDVSKPHLGLIREFLGLVGAQETLWD